MKHVVFFRLTYFNFIQFLNISSGGAADEALKFDISKNSKFSSFRNIYPVSLSSGVKKFDKFNDVIDLQFLNIPLAFLNFSVLNEDISNETNFSHPLNILTIKNTFEVSKEDKFKDIKDLQLENTLFIS